MTSESPTKKISIEDKIEEKGPFIVPTKWYDQYSDYSMDLIIRNLIQYVTKKSRTNWKYAFYHLINDSGENYRFKKLHEIPSGTYQIVEMPSRTITAKMGSRELDIPIYDNGQSIGEQLKNYLWIGVVGPDNERIHNLSFKEFFGDEISFKFTPLVRTITVLWLKEGEEQAWETYKISQEEEELEIIEFLTEKKANVDIAADWAFTDIGRIKLKDFPYSYLLAKLE
ncbi:MAG: hypothetical protein GF308_18980 [Candidatus Heimdallarchaeota archaeon]|nr:hypothetical protein [Candidatus Heimdallarchaeota archaeon]